MDQSCGISKNRKILIKSKIALYLTCFLYQMQAFCWTATLSERASNPITNLSQLQCENDFSPKNYGSTDSSNKILIKPLIALFFYQSSLQLMKRVSHNYGHLYDLKNDRYEQARNLAFLK